jgi:ribonuclease VapC
MLIDTSIPVAIHNKEPGYENLLKTIANAKRRWLSVSSYVEFVLVTKNASWLDTLIRLAEIEVVALSKADAEAAITGFLRFGKGRHAAALNFGDCLVYGTAKAAGVNLFFKGSDFSKTDILSVMSDGEEAS